MLSSETDGRSWRYQFEVPADLQHYIATKGSVTIDGTSLTDAAADVALFLLEVQAGFVDIGNQRYGL